MFSQDDSIKKGSNVHFSCTNKGFFVSFKTTSELTCGYIQLSQSVRLCILGSGNSDISLTAVKEFHFQDTH